jgi:hypothetical protein
MFVLTRYSNLLHNRCNLTRRVVAVFIVGGIVMQAWVQTVFAAESKTPATANTVAVETPSVTTK